jgi:hypothetical protein
MWPRLAICPPAGTNGQEGSGESDPKRVVLTTTDSNAWAGAASGRTHSFTRHPDGTTDLDQVYAREGKSLQGRFLELVFRTVGRSKLEKALVNSVKAIEAGSYKTQFVA